VDNNLLTEAQNGFRKNKSTDTASQTFIESIKDASERGLHAIELFFDLSKAYVINHDILLGKLNAYGRGGESSLWFKSYLSNHFQFVEIKETDCSNSVKNSYVIMHESGAWCAARLSSRATFVFVIHVYKKRKCAGGKRFFFADGTYLLRYQKR
jgi:hypothetical protein